MSMPVKRKRIATGLGLGLTIAAGLVWLMGRPAAADFPHTGLNFSISAGQGSEQCDSDGTGGLPATCTFATGATFAANFRVDSIPNGFQYQGYDSEVVYSSGLTVNPASLTQMGAGTWSECNLPAPFVSPPQRMVAPGCSVGLPPSPQSSTYAGVMWHIDLSCGGSTSVEAVTLHNGETHTQLVDSTLVSHGESEDESLTVNCGAPTTSTPTNTATKTPTKTATRTPTRTATPQGSCLLLGDADGSGATNSIDAALILQYAARLIAQVPRPACADVNRNGVTDAVDALLVLQIAAQLIPQP